MRSEEDIIERLKTIRVYYDAGWFDDDTTAISGASELLWILGFEQAAGEVFLKHGGIYHEERDEHVYL